MSINGTGFADTLYGTLGDDVIDALGGNDIIHGSQGNDTVDGGLGTDRLIFTLADTSLFDAAIAARSYMIGASSVTDSSSLLNTSFTSVENITFSTVGAGDYDDVINASGFTGTSLTVLLGNGNANVIGSIRADNITTGRGNNVISAGANNDTINASRGADSVDGGMGNDRLTMTMGNTALFDAAVGARTYTITNSHAGDSSGTLNTAMTSIERITLDTRNTGDFDDIIDLSGFTSAASFPVTILIGHGDNTITGTNFADTFTLGLGSNTLDAGGGTDEVLVAFDNNVAATMFVTGSGGSLQTSFNGVVNTITNAENIAISPLNVNGSSTVDASAVTGFAGQIGYRDTYGSDVLIGHDGRDFFSNTYIFTGGGDTYTGNGGADIYDYTFAVAAMDGDTITDLDADDIIDLQFNTAAQNGGGFLANQFIGAAAFSNVAGQYRYFTSGGQSFVQADTNGDGVADETLTISNGTFVLKETATGSNQLYLAGQVITGTNGANTLIGTLGDDIINALGGNDTIYASQGTDVIDGGPNTDTLFVNTFNSALFAAATGSRTYTLTSAGITDSSGTINTSFTSIQRVNLWTANNGDFGDTIDASAFVSFASGNVVMVTAGDGNDTIIGSNSTDFLDGRLGSNIVDAGGGADHVVARSDNRLGLTQYVSSVGSTVVTTENGVVTNQVTNAELVRVGGSYATNAVADGLTTRVDATAYAPVAGVQLLFDDHNGDDIFIGSSGADIFGNTYTFTIGTDVYRGNGGADWYDYAVAINALNDDVILDFDADDTIDFQFNDGVIPGQLLATNFIGADAFNGVVGEYRYQIDGARTLVQLDTNGDAIADRTLHIDNGGFALRETVAGSNQLVMDGAAEAAEGIVADGYLSGATLFIDVDGDKILDSGEAWTTTDADGNFSLNVTQLGTLVAFGGTNIDTGLANTMTLVAPEDSGVVNPLTTLVQAVIDASAGATTAAQAQALVLAALGLDPDLDLLNLDLISAAATDPAALEAQKAAAMIANLVAAVDQADGAGAGSEALLVDALADLVTSGGGTIDLTDTATLTPLLTEALPGVDVSEIAEEAAAEGEAIASATSIDQISDAQYDAQTFNHIAGGAGSDTITGTEGRDLIIGGDGKDFLSGGGGDDVFIAENTATKFPTKLGTMSLDVIFDFNAGDKIDLSGIDANSGVAGDQQFSWKGSNANKSAGDLSYKTYASVQGAEKALGIDIDGANGASPLSGPVTIVYGNVDGGSPDFAIVLIGTGSISASDFIFV